MCGFCLPSCCCIYWSWTQLKVIEGLSSSFNMPVVSVCLSLQLFWLIPWWKHSATVRLLVKLGYKTQLWEMGDVGTCIYLHFCNILHSIKNNHTLVMSIHSCKCNAMNIICFHLFHLLYSIELAIYVLYTSSSAVCLGCRSECLQTKHRVTRR